MESTDLAAARAGKVRQSLPPGGLFADQHWRIAPDPFHLEEPVAREFESLGRVLLQFHRAVNLLYRHSVTGRQPRWVAEYLDRGKPAALIELQRSPGFKSDLPRVIRPDVLLTENGLTIVELDSVPGGIGLTAWLNQVYSHLPETADAGVENRPARDHPRTRTPSVIGGPAGMMEGFKSIFGRAGHTRIVVSRESATYRPEMEWLCDRLGNGFLVQDTRSGGFRDGDAVYRFFELFDLRNVANGDEIFALAQARRIRVTPPPKPIFEEKMLFALLWNRNLREFWRRELGEAFFQRLLKLVPYTWIVDPTPLPPQGAIPALDLTDWHQLKQLSQRERDLVLKISGYSDRAWGARGVYLGSDLSAGDWSAAVDEALGSFEESPYVLQRYHKPRVVESRYFDFATHQLSPMSGRVRLCPYYFVAGDGDGARATLGGVLATICPADKKIIHGMKDAILLPCAA